MEPIENADSQRKEGQREGEGESSGILFVDSYQRACDHRQFTYSRLCFLGTAKAGGTHTETGTK